MHADVASYPIFSTTPTAGVLVTVIVKSKIIHMHAYKLNNNVISVAVIYTLKIH